MENFFEDPSNWMPYVISIVCAIVSGIASYSKARRETKHDMEKMEKQHVIDIENEREKHKLDLEKEQEKHHMEIERINLVHKHELEMKDKESQNQLGKEVMSKLFDKAMELPEVKEQLSAGLKQPGNRQQRRANK